MTILKESLKSGDGRAARSWHRFGHGDQGVRYTEAWEHETFQEEQARWERTDPEYARICEEVRHANETGGEASRRADQAKTEWDARVATLRQANDDAQRAHHALQADQTASHGRAAWRTSSRRRKIRLHTTLAIEPDDSPAPGIMPELVRVPDEPATPTAPPGERQGPQFRFVAPGTQSPVSDARTKLEVESWLFPNCPS